jgi:hypothetical protein
MAAITTMKAERAQVAEIEGLQQEVVDQVAGAAGQVSTKVVASPHAERRFRASSTRP